MFPEEALRTLVHDPELTHKEVLLLCLAVNAEQPKQVKEVRSLAVNAGCPEAQRWNVSAYLGRAEGLAIHVPDGWVLTSEGRAAVREMVGDSVTPRTAKVAISLRDHLDQVADSRTRAFLDEAVACFEFDLYRAAIVFSWVGAVSVLHQYVMDKRLDDFNREASRRHSWWKAAKTRDDLTAMKESYLLDILESIGVVDHSVKLQLKNCLQRRNACGHPSALQVSENQAAAHVEMLVQNVFSQFPL